MSKDNSETGLSTLSACSSAVQTWYHTNQLLLNADKSEVVVLGTSNQLKNSASLRSVSVAGTSLHVSTQMKSLGVTLDSHLTFSTHVNNVVKSCNYHTRAIRHVRHLLTDTTAQSLACCLINSRLDYCNALLYRAPASAINKLQRAQNNAARVVLQAGHTASSTPLLQQLHWLPVRQRITYKLGLITYKTKTSGLPAYLNQHLFPRAPPRCTRSASLPLLEQHRTTTEFARRAFSHAAPSVWNNLPADVLTSTSLPDFKRKLKTHLFREYFTD